MTLKVRLTYAGHVRETNHAPGFGWLALAVLGERPIRLHKQAQARSGAYRSSHRSSHCELGEDASVQVRAKNPGAGHVEGCNCARCRSSLLAYIQDADVSLPLLRKRVAVLSVALWADPARASDVLKRFHRAHSHFAQLRDARIAVVQSSYLAKTYELASTILWRRMCHYAMRDHPRRAVQAPRPTVMRGGVEDMFLCEECERLESER